MLPVSTGKDNGFPQDWTGFKRVYYKGQCLAAQHLFLSPTADPGCIGWCTVDRGIAFHGVRKPVRTRPQSHGCAPGRGSRTGCSKRLKIRDRVFVHGDYLAWAQRTAGGYGRRARNRCERLHQPGSRHAESLPVIAHHLDARKLEIGKPALQRNAAVRRTRFMVPFADMRGTEQDPRPRSRRVEFDQFFCGQFSAVAHSQCLPASGALRTRQWRTDHGRIGTAGHRLDRCRRCVPSRHRRSPCTYRPPGIIEVVAVAALRLPPRVAMGTRTCQHIGSRMARAAAGTRPAPCRASTHEMQGDCGGDPRPGLGRPVRR